MKYFKNFNKEVDKNCNKWKCILNLLLHTAFFVGIFSASTYVYASEIYLQNTVYLGVENYGNVSNENKDNFVHQFYVDGEIKKYKINLDNNNYTLQNLLATGYVYDLIIDKNYIINLSEPVVVAKGIVEDVSSEFIVVDGIKYFYDVDVKSYSIKNSAGSVIVNNHNVNIGEPVKIYEEPVSRIYQTVIAAEYEAPVSGIAGEKTLKNFLATAMEPVGVALYVYGGGWDWQDVGSSNEAKTIGISDKWLEFYENNNANYSYRNNSSYSKSYYPHKAWNQYYYAGLDCSGYVGWALYNTLHNDNGGEGYVMSSTQQAKTLAEKYKLGTWTQNLNNGFKAGDIFSMNGHVYICVGICDDGSMVILHSTPSSSISGNLGGGVQLTGVGNSANCEAAVLAEYYMSNYFPNWSERYDTIYKTYSSYTKISGNSAGKFSWHLSSEGLIDLEGYANMKADEILEDLFKDANKVEELEIINKGFATRGEAICYIWEALGKPTELKSSLPFVDVTNDNYELSEAVNWAVNNNITSGTSETTFSPNNSITRGQFVTFLWTYMGKPINNNILNPFEDVKKEDYYIDAVSWAVLEGITVGTSETTFSPNESVTHEQIKLFLDRFSNKYN